MHWKMGLEQNTTAGAAVGWGAPFGSSLRGGISAPIASRWSCQNQGTAAVPWSGL